MTTCLFLVPSPEEHTFLSLCVPDTVCAHVDGSLSLPITPHHPSGITKCVVQPSPGVHIQCVPWAALSIPTECVHYDAATGVLHLRGIGGIRYLHALHAAKGKWGIVADIRTSWLTLAFVAAFYTYAPHVIRYQQGGSIRSPASVIALCTETGEMARLLAFAPRAPEGRWMLTSKTRSQTSLLGQLVFRGLVHEGLRDKLRGRREYISFRDRTTKRNARAKLDARVGDDAQFMIYVHRVVGYYRVLGDWMDMRMMESLLAPPEVDCYIMDSLNQLKHTPLWQLQARIMVGLECQVPGGSLAERAQYVRTTNSPLWVLSPQAVRDMMYDDSLASLAPPRFWEDRSRVWGMVTIDTPDRIIDSGLIAMLALSLASPERALTSTVPNVQITALGFAKRVRRFIETQHEDIKSREFKGEKEEDGDGDGEEKEAVPLLRKRKARKMEAPGYKRATKTRLGGDRLHRTWANRMLQWAHYIESTKKMWPIDTAWPASVEAVASVRGVVDEGSPTELLPSEVPSGSPSAPASSSLSAASTEPDWLAQIE